MGTMSAASMNSISRVQGQKRSKEKGNRASAKPNPTKATLSNRFLCFPLPAHFIQERLVLLQDGENGGTLSALQYTNKSQHCDPAGEKEETNPNKLNIFALCFLLDQSLSLRQGSKVRAAAH